MPPVNVAILGTGAIVREFHLPALLANPRARVVALGNLRAESLQALAASHGITRTYTDLDRLAADPDIEAVVNALPNYLHAPVTVQMLQAGKHVLCEKPMAMSGAEAEAMIAAAEATDRTLAIAHVWRSSQEYRWLREVVASGALGTVFKARIHSVLAGAGPPPASWFVDPKLAGGGALADIGIHGLDNLAFVMDDSLRPRSVFARTSTRFQPIAVEDTATAVVEYEGGLIATLEAGWHHRYSGNPHGALELFGTEGHARTFPAEVHSAMGGRFGAFRPVEEAGKDHIGMPMYAAQMDQFLDCLLAGAPPACSGRQSLPSLRVVEAAYLSARTGEAVAIQAGGP
jgi:predicted dehydrogenase